MTVAYRDVAVRGEGDGGDCFYLYLRRGNVGNNCSKFVVILSSSLLAVKSLLVGDL